METKDSMLTISILLDNSVFVWSTGHNKNYYYYSLSGSNQVHYLRRREELKAGSVFNDHVILLFFN